MVFCAHRWSQSGGAQISGHVPCIVHSGSSISPVVHVESSNSTIHTRGKISTTVSVWQSNLLFTNLWTSRQLANEQLARFRAARKVNTSTNCDTNCTFEYSSSSQFIPPYCQGYYFLRIHEIYEWKISARALSALSFSRNTTVLIFKQFVGQRLEILHLHFRDDVPTCLLSAFHRSYLDKESSDIHS